MDVPGLITTFSPLITEMEVYYDVDDKYGPVRFPSGIEEKYSDFTQRFKTRQICDPGQWIYEEFTPRRARWTYILTNEDYERAKMMSGNRTENSRRSVTTDLACIIKKRTALRSPLYFMIRLASCGKADFLFPV